MNPASADLCRFKCYKLKAARLYSIGFGMMRSMSTTTIPADPENIASELAEIDTRLETVQSDEAATEAELRTLEADADNAATEAYLSGKVVKVDAKTDGLRARLRAIRSAKVTLMAKRDLLEADHQSATIDSLIATAGKLNEERTREYELALALLSVSSRLFGRSLGDPTGSYPLNGRVGNCGIVSPTDSNPAPYLVELGRISNELRALGFTEAEAVCLTRASAVPGGQQLRGGPVPARVRSLANRIETGLVAGELLPSSYPTINPDVPTNLE